MEMRSLALLFEQIVHHRFKPSFSAGLRATHRNRPQAAQHHTEKIPSFPLSLLLPPCGFSCERRASISRVFAPVRSSHRLAVSLFPHLHDFCNSSDSCTKNPPAPDFDIASIAFATFFAAMGLYLS